MSNTQEPKTFLNLPKEVQLKILDNVLAGEYITVEPDPNLPYRSCWRLPAQALTLANVSREFCKPSPMRIETLVCKEGARPTGSAIPEGIRRSITTIILENTYMPAVDTAAFPNLRAILCCREGDFSYLVVNLNHYGHDLTDIFEIDKLIQRQQAEIHSQIIPQLPSWMEELVLDPASQVELTIRVTVLFRTDEDAAASATFRFDEDGIVEVEPPSWRMPMSLLYSWKAGRAYNALCPSRAKRRNEKRSEERMRNGERKWTKMGGGGWTIEVDEVVHG
ncbi:uncharacterized protein A1O5_13070 [Cladophialophora psammophila CBS 110553]|uniref:F-box domain-containing protein n=1 Tax=Cladophialophora psammophila CBS 110553 TaxID=1182543 RepID=W9W568_9EURO|nr:uncharacterized protein A1O5_13070 [Cladophialophora psammophila CBS 110553]EXJ53714.1 hypothetical protein A1O5_13070 [Cladophialophora psammophila CBS 110553]